MKYSFTIICILLLLLAVYSQKEDYNWVFSKNRHIDFNTNPPNISTIPHNLIVIGCSSMSDENGNLQFYFDGKKIYNYQHQVILAFPPTSVVNKLVQCVPHPAINKNFFYISAVQQGAVPHKRRQVLYLIDMNANAGKGKVTEASIMDTEEYLTNRFLITRKFNSKDYWFLRFLDNRIIRNIIDSSGLKDDTSVKNFMKVDEVIISPDMSKVCIIDYSRTKYYIADYNSQTAEITNIKQFAEENDVNGRVSIFRFSRSGNYLFYIAHQAKAFVIKYDMSKSNNVQALKNSAETLPVINPTNNIETEKIYDASLAPNGKIYILVQGINYFFAIEEDNTVDEGYVLNKKSLSLSGKVGISLPHFFIYHASFNCDIDCNKSTFNYIGMPLQSQQWNFGDGTISTETNPTHIYTAPGTYTVKLTATYTDGTTQIATKNITVSEKPKKPVILHD